MIEQRTDRSKKTANQLCETVWVKHNMENMAKQIRDNRK
jgi:hypothetical protein